MTTYLIVFTAIVVFGIIIIGFRRSPRLSGASTKPSADALLRKLYSQYWAQVTALTQARMLDAPSDEQWLAEIKKRAFASVDSQTLSGSLPAAFQDSRDAIQRGPALQRLAGFLLAFASGYGRPRRRWGSVLHHRGITATAAATAVVLLTAGTSAVAGLRPVSPDLREVSASPASYGVQFPPGQFTLSNADRDNLEGLANTIKQSSAPVTVSGYADDLGTAVADRSLALKRAQTVAAFLQTCGISTSRLTIQGARLHVPGPVSRSVTIFIWQDPGNG